MRVMNNKFFKKNKKLAEQLKQLQLGLIVTIRMKITAHIKKENLKLPVYVEASSHH